MKATSIILTLLIAMLTGCATPSGTGKTALSGTQARLVALTKVKNDASLIMEVPSASNAKEAVNVLGGKDTVHNRYGGGGEDCENFWNASPNNQPVLQPVKVYPATQSKE